MTVWADPCYVLRTEGCGLSAEGSVYLRERRVVDSRNTALELLEIGLVQCT